MNTLLLKKINKIAIGFFMITAVMAVIIHPYGVPATQYLMAHTAVYILVLLLGLPIKATYDNRRFKNAARITMQFVIGASMYRFMLFGLVPMLAAMTLQPGPSATIIAALSAWITLMISWVTSRMLTNKAYPILAATLGRVLGRKLT